MKENKLRDTVLNYIRNNADEEFLNLVNDMAITYQSNVIEEKINIENYNNDLNIAISEIAEKKTYAHEEVGEHIKQWTKR
jgi:hypothetical protein